MELEVNGIKLKCYDDSRIERYWLNTKKWRVCKGSNNNGYLTINIKHKLYKFHRIIYKAFHPNWDLNSPLEIDHINRDKTDNRIENLRLVTSQENKFNIPAKGYSFIIKIQKWRGHIKKDGKLYGSRNFDTEQEARDWYLQKKEILHTYSSFSP